MCKLLLRLLVCVSIAAPLWGAGFSIQEIGTRAAGMGGAFIAVASDGSALYYNPAGIAFQPGFRMEMHTLLVQGDFRFSPSSMPQGTILPAGGYYQGFVKPKFLVVPNTFMTFSLQPKLTFGLGVFAPFGLGGNWTNFADSDPQNTKFISRWQNSRSRLESIWVQPTVAYRVSDRLSLAVGVALVRSHVMLEQSFLNPTGEAVDFGKVLAPVVFPGQNVDAAARAIARLLPEVRGRFAGMSNNVGANLGLLYWHPGWKTRFGATYRTAVPQHFQGQASFAITEKYALKPVVTLGDMYGFFPNQKAFATLTTPGTYAVGVATEAFGRNLFAVDLQLQDYRRLKDVVLNFSKTKDTAFQPEQRLPFDFRNAYAVKLGWERPIKGFSVRAGWSFDGTPVPEKSVSPLWPDSSRLNHTVGVSKESKGREISVFYQFMKFLPRTTNVAANAGIYTNGDWKSTAQLFGFSMRLRKGGKSLEMRH